MKRFRLVLAVLLVAVAVSVVVVMSMDFRVNVEQRFYEFIENSKYEKEDLEEYDQKGKQDNIEFFIKNDIFFKQKDIGSTFYQERLAADIHVPDEKAYMDDFVTLAHYSIKDEYDEFDFEAIIEDMLTQDPEYHREIYFNDHVHIIVERMDEKIYLDIYQNSTSEVTKMGEEEYRDKGITERLQP